MYMQHAAAYMHIYTPYIPKYTQYTPGIPPSNLNMFFLIIKNYY